MRLDRDRVAHVWRLRNDARRARLLAAQTTASADHRLLQRLADGWDQQADTLESAVNDDRRVR